jgi:hypothetical protein
LVHQCVSSWIPYVMGTKTNIVCGVRYGLVLKSKNPLPFLING